MPGPAGARVLVRARGIGAQTAVSTFASTATFLHTRSPITVPDACVDQRRADGSDNRIQTGRLGVTASIT